MQIQDVSPTPIRPTVAEIDFKALAANLRAMRSALGPRIGVVAVVKADAYGHGALPVARLLEGLGVWGFGVATVEEGVQLREAGIRVPVIVMGAAFGQDHAELVARDLTPVIGTPWDMACFAKAAQALGRMRFGVHLKIDTGMTRLGVTVLEFEQVIRSVTAYPWIRIDGLMTHFACAEDADPEPTQRQVQRFIACLDQARALGADPQVIHAANTAAALRFPDTRFDLVRPGIGLYGVVPSAHVPNPGLQPVLSWRTQITALREVAADTGVSYGATFVTREPSRIATLPVGYADGYPRRLAPGACVLLVDRWGRSQRVPVVGRVCMDLCMLDVSGVEGVSVGDTAYLLGGVGEQAIHPDELAAWADTITYQLWVGISKRVPRVYPGWEATELGVAHRGEEQR